MLYSLKFTKMLIFYLQLNFQNDHFGESLDLLVDQVNVTSSIFANVIFNLYPKYKNFVKYLS